MFSVRVCWICDGSVMNADGAKNEAALRPLRLSARVSYCR